MKDFSGLILCDHHSARVDVHVRADLFGGKLVLSCQDLGPVVEEFWGDEDYEYWYRLDEDSTTKLLTVIGGMSDPEGALVREFSGIDGCAKLRAVCEEKGILYSFSSYV